MPSWACSRRTQSGTGYSCVLLSVELLIQGLQLVTAMTFDPLHLANSTVGTWTDQRGGAGGINVATVAPFLGVVGLVPDSSGLEKLLPRGRQHGVDAEPNPVLPRRLDDLVKNESVNLFPDKYYLIYSKR